MGSQAASLRRSRSAPDLVIPVLEATSTIQDVVRAALGSALAQYLRCEPLLGISDDIEALHKARVAIRKIRSHLHSFLPVLEEAWARDLRDRLRSLQDVLAPVRDADVFYAAMTELIRQLAREDSQRSQELLNEFEAQKQTTRRTLRDYLHSDGYVALLDDLVNGIREPRFNATSKGAASNYASPLMRRVLKKVRRCVRDAGNNPSDRALHRIRIKAKHLRYASEAFAEVLGDRASSYASRVESLQEMLGLQHDGVVAVSRLREVHGSPQTHFLAGELAMLAQSRGSTACSQWRDCWKTICKKRNRFW